MIADSKDDDNCYHCCHDQQEQDAAQAATDVAFAGPGGLWCRRSCPCWGFDVRSCNLGCAGWGRGRLDCSERHEHGALSWSFS